MWWEVEALEIQSDAWTRVKGKEEQERSGMTLSDDDQPKAAVSRVARPEKEKAEHQELKVNEKKVDEEKVDEKEGG